jgi:hypothetical protein
MSSEDEATAIGGKQQDNGNWRQTRKIFCIKVAVVGFALQLLFLGNLSYLYGSLWGSENRFDNLRVLYLNLDGGEIGDAVTDAYQTLQGPSFPSLIMDSSSDLRSVDDALQAVRRGWYWASVVVNANASVRLAAALEGGDAAQTYQPADAMTYVWNEVRYSAISDEAFSANFELLAETAQQVFLQQNGRSALASVNQSDDNALQAMFNPISITSVNIAPTTNGSRQLYNTVTMLMPILQAFFFILSLNALSDQFHIYGRVSWRLTGLKRVVFSLTYTFCTSLGMTGYIWGFRETTPLNGNQFVLSWMTIWLLHLVHFLVIDTVTAFLPFPAIPFFLITWIIINISSTFSPLVISAGFYRWAYALPANEAYTVLTDIWSGGSVPELYRTLPILFSWLVAGAGLAAFGHFHRCRTAHQREATQQKLQTVPESDPAGHYVETALKNLA